MSNTFPMQVENLKLLRKLFAGIYSDRQSKTLNDTLFHLGLHAVPWHPLPVENVGPVHGGNKDKNKKSQRGSYILGEAVWLQG